MNENKIIETLKYISQFVENRHDEGLGDYLHIVIGRTDIDVIDETIFLLERKQKEIVRYKKEIKKQQKAIKELMSICDLYKGASDNCAGIFSDTIKDNFISKDKIRNYFAQAIAFKRRLIRENEEISDYNRGKFDTIEDLLERLEDNKWN